MAIKYLKILSSRKTVIGHLRFGIVYALDDTDARVTNVIKALTDKGTKDAPKRPAAVVLSKKEVEAEAAAVESLVPDPEQANATEAAMRKGDDAAKQVAALKKD